MLTVLIDALLVGFFMALPVGPANVEIIRRTSRGMVASPLWLGAGNAAVDGLWAFIAYWGVAPILQFPTTRLVLYGVSAAITITLGILAIREFARPQFAKKLAVEVPNKRMALLTGAGLGVANPLMIIWWLAILGLMHSAGILGTPNWGDALSIGGGMACGAMAYFVFLIWIVRRLRTFFSVKTLRIMSLVFGITLLVLAGWTVFHLATQLAEMLWGTTG